jgi:hypothetical protein
MAKRALSLAGKQRPLPKTPTRVPAVRRGGRSGLDQDAVPDHVLLLRARADQVIPETFARSAHPSNPPRRISDHQREIRDIPGDNGAGADEAKHAERMAAHHRCIRSDRCPLADRRGPELILARDVGARIVDVGENAARSAKHVVSQLDAVIDRHIVLDLASVADPNVGTNHDVLSDRAILADHGAGKDMAKMPDLGALTDHRAVIDKAGNVNQRAGKPRVFPHFAHARFALMANG